MRTLIRAAAAAGVAAAPLLLPLGLSSDRLPPGLAHVVGPGRWLVLVGAAATFLIALLAEHRSGLSPALRTTGGIRTAPGWLRLLPVPAALAFFSAIPSYRWSGESFGGDEPKYVRMAVSLARDLDVDLAGEALTPLTTARAAASAHDLLLTARDALVDLATGRRGPRRAEQVWNLGNWTVAGLHGGRFYVQSPGLPLLLAPAVALEDRLRPGQPPGVLFFSTLAALWTAGLVATAALASRASGSRGAGVLTALAAAFSAPCFVGGYHVYPEVAAWAIAPCCAAALMGSRPLAAKGGVVMLGLALGFLPWLHSKFLLLALTLLAIALSRTTGARARSLLAASAALPVLSLLLFDFRVTGLFRPDALYQRYGGSVYTGLSAFLSRPMLNGLVTALFGARDGLFVIAPVLAGGLLAVPLAWRRDRRATLELAVVFASLWVVAAVHEGGAPGPPGRLMAPVAFVPAAFLAVGLARAPRPLILRFVAAALALVSVSITWTLRNDWRRVVNPYRDMFTRTDDFSRDLPDGSPPAGVSLEQRKPRDLARGVLLGGVLALWAWALSRPQGASKRSVASRLALLHAAAWTTLAATAAALHALGP